MAPFRSLRPLLRARRFLVLVTLVLGIGFGALLAAGSLAVQVFLSPPPYPDAERIVRLAETVGRDPANTVTVSYLNASDWAREGDGAIEGVGLSRAFQSSVLSWKGETSRLESNYVDRAYLDLLGARPALGRLFNEAEGRPGAGAAVALLSHEAWTRRFEAAPGIVGEAIRLDGHPHVVIGVLAPAFHDVTSAFVDTDVWLPLGSPVLPVPEGWGTNRSGRYFRVYARWRSGVSSEAGTTALDGVAAGLEARYPDSNREFGIAAIPLEDQFFGTLDGPLLAVLGAAAFLLVVALANATSLFAGRALARAGSTAVRRALGASEARLRGAAALEGLAAAVAGSTAAAVVAVGLMAMLRASDALALPGFVSLALHPGTVASAIGGLCLLLPLLALGVHTTSRAPEIGRIGTRSASAAPAGGRGRAAFVSVQIAAATALVTGASLLVRSARSYEAEPSGLDVRDQVLISLQLPSARYPTEREPHAFALRLLERADAAGPELAIWAPQLPGRSGVRTTLVVEGRPVTSQLEAQITRYHNVSPGALPALGIPILQGRSLGPADGADAAPVAVVSRSLARALWPDEDPIGRRVRNFVPEGSPFGGDRNPWVEVVGVAADARHSGRLVELMPAEWDIYYPYAQRYRGLGTPTLIVPGGMRDDDVSRLRDAVAAVDAELPLGEISTLRSVVGIEFAVPRFVTTLLLLLGSFALGLSLLGLYGVQSEALERRRAELAVRRAVGARAPDFVRLLGGPTARRASVAVTIGLVVAAATSRILSSVLYETPAVEPTSYATAALVVLATVLGATVPAVIRACRVDPAGTLKGP